MQVKELREARERLTLQEDVISQKDLTIRSLQQKIRELGAKGLLQSHVKDFNLDVHCGKSYSEFVPLDAFSDCVGQCTTL